MGALQTIPTAATPIERILSRFNREQVEAFIEIAIRLVDAIDGDPDMEDSETGSVTVDDRGRETLYLNWRTEDDEPDNDDLEHDGREPEAVI